MVNCPPPSPGFLVGTATFGAPLLARGDRQTSSWVNAADAGAPATAGVDRLLTRTSRARSALIAPRRPAAFASRRRTPRTPARSRASSPTTWPASPPPGISGIDPRITIPSVRISQDTGNALKAALGRGANATLGVNPAVRAGARRPGGALLSRPTRSPSARPSRTGTHRLPQPAHGAVDQRRPDFPHGAFLDLTRQEMIDIGWFSDGPDGVPRRQGPVPHSVPPPAQTVVIDGCDSGVPNTTFTTPAAGSPTRSTTARSAPATTAGS